MMKKRWERLKERDKALQKKTESFEFEKGDGLALFIAAFVTLLPALLIVIGLLLLIIWIVF